MLYYEVQESPEIRDLKVQYLQQGIDFDAAYKDAIYKATEGIVNPATKAVTLVVSEILKDELQRCLIKKASTTAGTTWFGRAWRKLVNALSGKR